MKARIPKKDYDPNTIGVPKKLIEDKQYAKEFWDYLTQSKPEGEFGTFDDWYNNLSTLDFKQKCYTISSIAIGVNRATRRADKNKQRR